MQNFQIWKNCTEFILPECFTWIEIPYYVIRELDKKKIETKQNKVVTTFSSYYNNTSTVMDSRKRRTNRKRRTWNIGRWAILDKIGKIKKIKEDIEGKNKTISLYWLFRCKTGVKHNVRVCCPYIYIIIII